MIRKFNKSRWCYLATDKDIAEINRRIGHEGLPHDYVDFMKTYNDFMPDPELADGYCFKIQWSEQHDERLRHCCSEAILEVLDIIHPDPPLINLHGHSSQVHTIIESINNCLIPGSELIPLDTIPIGSDPGGYLLLMGIGKDNHGEIYFWVADYPFEPGEPTYDNIGFVANNFTEFLESLYPCEEG